MPSTWETYGVDANGDGVARSLQPRRRDLRRGPLPQRRRHAGRHLRRDLLLQPRRLVRRRGARQRRLLRRRRRRLGAGGGFALTPQHAGARLHSRRRPGGTQIPADYLDAFENAAARYELGDSAASGPWPRSPGSSRTSAAAWAPSRCDERGPLGLDPSEWSTVRGRRRRRRPHPPRRHRRLGGDPGPADLVAGSLRAGIFTHNQADWYVQAVLGDAEAARRRLQDQLRRLAGRPARLGFETPGPSAVLDQRLCQRSGRRTGRRQGSDRRRQLDRHHPLHLGRWPRQLVRVRLRLLGRRQLRPLRRRTARHPPHLGFAGELWRTGAAGAGSRSTRARPTLMRRSPGCVGTQSAMRREPGRAGTLSLLIRRLRRASSGWVLSLRSRRLTERRGSLPRPLRGEFLGRDPRRSLGRVT